MTQKFVFIAEPGDREKERLAFELAQRLTDGGTKSLTYVANDVQGFASEFDWLFGRQDARAIEKRQRVGLITGAQEVASLRTIKPGQIRGVVLGIRCIPETLEKIDQCVHATDVIFLSFNEEEGLAWAKKHKAEIIR